MKKSKILAVIILSLMILSQLIALDKVMDFRLENMKGKQVNLSDFQSEGLVIIDFWATWCSPCKKALPKLNEIHNEYDHVQVVSICTDKPRNKEKAKTLIKSHRYDFEVLFDLNRKVQKQFNVTSIPRTLIVAPDGTILLDHTGYKPGDEDHIKEVIEEWIAENGQIIKRKSEKAEKADCANK